MKLKRLGYGLSAVALTASILPMGNVFAAEPTTVSTYAELVTALGNKEVSEIKLGADIKAAFGVEVNNGEVKPGTVYRLTADHDVVIDTNGFTLSDNGAKECLSDKSAAMTCNMIYVKDGAKLTLKGNGKIVAARYAAGADKADLIIDGATLEATNEASYGVYVSNGGSATIESGSVTADYAAFAGNNTTGDMNFYINGGTLTSLRYPAIYMPGQVYLTMTDGTLNGGIAARLGQITVSGGTINGQKNNVVSDGLDKNYGGMPSMTEGIALIAGGNYKSNNAEFGNKVTLNITGGTINNDVNIYDLGNQKEGYQHTVDVKISGGDISAVNTKFTEETIGFKLAEGYEAGANVKAGRVAIEISGGVFEEAPAEEYVKEGLETETNADGEKIIVPATVDLSEVEGVKTPELGDENTIAGEVKFFDEIVADRKATLSIEKADAEDFAVDAEKAGELVLAFDINLLDRNGDKIEVKDNDINVYLDLTKEQYEALAEYDSVKVIYFENGEEKERLDAMIYDEGNDVYSLAFHTTHFSSYGVAGVNNPVDPADPAAETPDTGVFTATSAKEAGSNVAGAIATAVVVAVVTMAGVALKLNKR